MPTLLVITVFLPLIGALALLLQPRLDHRSARGLALVTVLATLALSLLLGLNFEVGRAGFQFAHDAGGGTLGYRWLDVPGGPGVRFALGLDGISLVLFVLTALLMIPSVFASWESVTERAATHYALMLMLATGLLGLFSSLDVILFYIFFEFTLIPLFFLIGLYGGPERRRASIYFFLYTLAGSLLTLLGVITLVVIHKRHAGPLTFSIPELTAGLASLPWDQWTRAATTTWASPQALIFLLLFAGFAIKVPLFPFHTWLPLAHVEAPTAGSILLAGVLLKVGGYGFLRFNLGMTPHGAAYWLPLMLVLSVAGIIYGALTALAQTDVKKLVAYSSVSHMGFIALGLFALNTTGIDGAVIQMINHGLTTGALFACVGVFYERYHTREMGELGGLWERLPLLAFFLILASLGSMAVPGLNGFVGEFPILLGAFARNPLAAVLGATGMVLGAYYLLQMLQRVLFGPLVEPGAHGHHEHEGVAGMPPGAEPVGTAAGTHGHGPATAHESGAVRPVGWHEVAGLAPLMVLIVAIGVYPKPIFDRIGPPVRELAARFQVDLPPGTVAHPARVGRLSAPAPAAVAAIAVAPVLLTTTTSTTPSVPACCDVPRRLPIVAPANANANAAPAREPAR
jgi:NADH-quinone oxidoreductase subunit M